MNVQEYINQTKLYVKTQLQGAEAGHDWSHIERVYHNSMRIAKTEEADELVVALGALLHDIADSKFHNGDEEIGPKMASEFLGTLGLDKQIQDRVVDIVTDISFKNSLSEKQPKSKSIELQVVQDADRLDAIGAIGIARAFNYGGYKNRPLYDPEISPNLQMTKEEYKRSNNPTINHFYEKLLLLRDQMNTATGRELAEERHKFMLDFLDRFQIEWHSKD